MPNKLTDEQIIKALECCAVPLPEFKCDECPAGANGGCAMKTEDVIELINCLEARIGVYETCNARKDEAIKHLESEVKKLKAENERLNNNISAMAVTMSNSAKATRHEAYKEFAEKAKEELYDWVGADNCVTYPRIKRVLDNLLKELEGEKV